MEQQIKIAAKLYECRDTARKLYKKKYYDKLIPYKALIEMVCKANKMDILPAVLRICSADSISDDGMAIMMVMAAAVELIEPSK